MRKILSTIAFCLLSVWANSQTTEVKGVIYNAETNTPVEFANIGIEGTYLGAASDFEGKFMLELSENLSDNTIRISAVGFKPKTVKVGEWLSATDLKVLLAPTNYGISEVDIKAKSKIAYGIIRTASNLVAENYPQNSFAIEYDYSANEGLYDKNKSIRKVAVHDEFAYTNRSYTESYKSRSYQFDEVKDKDSHPILKEGVNWMEYLLLGDVVRVTGNVLSLKTIDDFDINIKEESVYNNDSVWVITYNCLKPTIANTACTDVEKYNGTIIISKENYAILKNTVSVTKGKSVMFGNTFMASADAAKKEVSFTMESSYKKIGELYFLDEVNYAQGDKVVSLKSVKQLQYNPSIKSHQFYSGSKY
ncbi:carboxypeptidase-like regulatory domain-containing protein [Saccharicrinis aurantiacus]|uniref:carboxypeptidase-like regulatory domain-containing protein n=1 Tax=Saccharicrinis aurantiacus TaxID=1849719 RepID=UPI0008393577|nr:carboxypeptidase-like regulatory domain-containing protein [Saccharicrinis aurantiacus]